MEVRLGGSKRLPFCNKENAETLNCLAFSNSVAHRVNFTVLFTVYDTEGRILKGLLIPPAFRDVHSRNLFVDQNKTWISENSQKFHETVEKPNDFSPKMGLSSEKHFLFQKHMISVVHARE